MPADSPANIFSIDVEDWFHAQTESDMAGWSRFESRVERNLKTLLDILDGADMKATCFVLGWVAEHYPSVVREAASRGHELASHGYAHRLVSSQTREEFGRDIRRAKDTIEQASGKKVRGYRAPAFSLTNKTPWAFDELIAAGYEYDSSIFPATREDGGIVGFEKAPHVIKTPGGGSLIEFPVSVARFLRKDICFFGGGYLRLFPAFMIRRMAAQVNREGRPVIYYVHPREIDPTHPRLPMSPLKRFKRYVNLETTVPKIQMLMKEQQLTTFENWLAANRRLVCS